MKKLMILKKIYAKYKGGDYLVKYLRDRGMSIGKECRIFSDISTSESYLIQIGNRVTISNDVQLITHDASIQKVIEDVTDVFGKIKIGDDCFIGARSIIMYGVTLAENTIVAAGSVVTKSFLEGGKIIGGNPAKVISDVKTYAEKMHLHAVNIEGLSAKQKKELLQNETILVVR